MGKAMDLRSVKVNCGRGLLKAERIQDWRKLW